MYHSDHLKTTLFLDIETVPEFKSYGELTEIRQKLWKKKARSLDKSLDVDNADAVAGSYSQRAGIYSEFSKIICISVGYLNSDGHLRIKSFFGDSEKQILLDFVTLLQLHYNDPGQHFICGHNIKEFDIPFLCRRLLIHQIGLPTLLQISGKKPWQTEYLMDTMDLWRFGDIKSYTSLELLATTLGIETPKGDIDGSQVAEVYYNQGDIHRIVNYCQKDVVTVVQIMMRFCYQPLLSTTDIEIVS